MNFQVRSSPHDDRENDPEGVGGRLDNQTLALREAHYPGALLNGQQFSLHLIAYRLPVREN